MLSAVVLRWSRARKRYERQGLLVDAEALERAEGDCLADAEARARRRQRENARRATLDAEHASEFATRVRELFPRCPEGTANQIAEHACQTSSGRIGRTATGKALEDGAVRLAVIAHVRHAETAYDALLARGYDRDAARAEIAPAVKRVVARWEGER